MRRGTRKLRLRKAKSGWKRVSWEEALDEIAERIQFFKESHGNGSIIRTS